MFTEAIFYIKTVLSSLLSFVLLTISCNNSQENGSDSNNPTQRNYDYRNGYYCSVVTYSNPNTGKSSHYTLTVEVDGDKVIKIFWPNGGWLDDSHFTPEEVDEIGIVEFITDKGYNYKVQLGDFGKCPPK